ncbi:MAG TPA: DUF4124 domain-containing protein [Gammaproteobacteria bacterium]|nr:DUF4124 domain-containing protein [Gammaproteobacteria bacterium]
MLVGALGAHGAEVYRSTDANGTVRYSDRPLDQNAKQVYVAAAPRTRAAPAPAPARPGAGEAQDDAAKQVDPNRGVQAETTTPAQQAEVKAKNCEVAKQRKQSYSEAHRLFKTDANGQRVYLSDSEIDTARARAEADVHTWCD